ncbi:hypothetical protein LNP74_31510 [Klebsiella pneumoniae subsp. pneumoniae]|nr:hypothetical protein [Klebsiella pneumoniae subsp. pneumoniae]
MAPRWRPLRLLAQHCEPLFFQRLRVEQQIGYVVSCRYQRVSPIATGC